MTTMNDLFVRGELFAGEAGLKTGADLEDLATRAYPTASSQLVDQSSLETYPDAAVTDDDGNPINRVRVKDGGISAAKLATDAVETAKIKDGAVTAVKLATGTITATQLAAGSVTAAKIALVPVFNVFNSVNQSVSVSTWTKVTLDNELLDSHGYFAASRFTPLVAGYYVFVGHLDFNTAMTNAMIVAGVFKNGTGGGCPFVKNFGTTSANNSAGVCIATPPMLANGTTDYFELWAYQDEVNPATLYGTGCWFGGWFVCGAA